MNNQRIVVMGVSGCGKTTVGLALAERLGARFVEGDQLHPPQNVERMASGIPLTDTDRWPWLDAVGAALAGDAPVVASCSALKRSYRDRLRAQAGAPLCFLHLAGDRAALAQRPGPARPRRGADRDLRRAARGAARSLSGGPTDRLMARIAILGAGFMGGALTVPAADNGHTVALWGTHLDDHLIAAVRAGAKHPKLGLVLPPAVTAYDSTELPRALAGADLVVCAVTSDGALPVLRRAATRIAPGVPVLSVSKGLAQSRGRAVTLSDAIADAAKLQVVTVGGPSKALEL